MNQSLWRPLRSLFIIAGSSALVALSIPSAAAAPTAAKCGVLREGSRGACVLALQQRLSALHYDLAQPDGVFGTQTFHAVVAFQKVNQLNRTGLVGSDTRQRLFSHPLAPRVHYITSGNGLEVNLAHQVLLRVSAGRVDRIFDVSTGRSGLATPVSGASPMHIWRKVLWGTTGYNDSEHYVQYYRAGTLLAIHEYGYVPPYPASHGCIRVPPGSAGRLFSTTYVGERVYTYY